VHWDFCPLASSSLCFRFELGVSESGCFFWFGVRFEFRVPEFAGLIVAGSFGG